MKLLKCFAVTAALSVPVGAVAAPTRETCPIDACVADPSTSSSGWKICHCTTPTPAPTLPFNCATWALGAAGPSGTQAEFSVGSGGSTSPYRRMTLYWNPTAREWEGSSSESMWWPQPLEPPRYRLRYGSPPPSPAYQRLSTTPDLCQSPAQS